MSPIHSADRIDTSNLKFNICIRWFWGNHLAVPLLSFLLIFVGFTPGAACVEAPSDGDHKSYSDRQFKYAEFLFNKGQFIKAATEFDRFVFFHPKDHRVPKARYQAAQAYFRGNRFDDAVKACQAVIEKDAGAVYSAKFYLLLARARIEQKDFNQALVTLHNVLSIYQDPDIQDEARYLGAWVYIQAAQWPNVRTWLNAITHQGRDVFSVEPMFDKLSTIDSIPQKNPRLAGFLAMIPGLGHLYTGRYQDALTAFLLNGLTIWGTYEAFDDNHPGLGSLLGLVGLNLYVGNLYSAVNTTHQFNRRAHERFIKGFGPLTSLRFSIGPRDGGVGMMVAFDF